MALCMVFQAFNVSVPALALGLEDPEFSLRLPAAAALDVGAVAVGGGRAALSAVLAEGKTLSVSMNATDAAETGLSTDAFLADVGAPG